MMAKIQWKSKEELLEEDKVSKKQAISQECHNSIVNGFDYTISGKTYHFSYDMEAQTNFQETYQLFQNNVIDGIKWSAKLDGKSVRLDFNKQNFERLFYQSVKHKQELISKLKDEVEPIIKDVTTKEELDNISWDNVVETPKDFKLSKTMDKELVNLTMRTEMSDMALMEIANMVMGME